ncbi:MAG: tol-pal system YbgF family protein [Planctomycetaceae bacterium]
MHRLTPLCRVLLLTLLTSVVIPAGLPAKDRLVLQPRKNASPLVLACDIVDYTAQTISVHINIQSEVRHFPAAEITSVEAVQTEPHRQGVQQFLEGRISEAVPLFEQALVDEPREWVRREIRGWLVRCAVRRGDAAAAGSRFLEIVERERAPREYPLIPLVWGTVELGTSLRRQAREWLTGETDVHRLLGASVLLLDTSYADITANELRRLSRSTDRRVSSLARTQLWRLRVTGADVTANELAEWEREIESLPRELRAGPYYVLGRASFRRNEYDRAAAAYLWLTTVYGENEPLTAQATLEAARSLERLGRTAEARALLVEVTARFDWSIPAAEARLLLNQLPRSQDTQRDG